ncbi:ABC transporter permease [Arenicella xantha]|uniref:Sodium transport system permease protein n=1 Tax=Arenicella xantha TaxID=644221 RepID=A0A395JQJ0_9GAMM|nr:ABC transporter permease [Arenicella xantha]RBP52825.1 sodium transport system permease protein [Arenicella xantha]
MQTHNINNLRGFWTILRKEVIDNLRDRRTLTTMAVSIVVGPLLLFGFLWFAEKTVKEETDLVNAEPTQLPVVGADNAPNLMTWLAQNNIEIVAPPSEPEQAVKRGELRVVLVVPENYAAAFTAGESAPVRLIHDSSISGLDKIGYRTVQKALLTYSSQIGSMRLVARGVNPSIVKAVQINVSDVASPQARNAQVLSMMPYLIILFIMVGGMYLAIDTTAGEREKGSLEPLLTQPISRSTILLAKLGATVVFSALTLLLVLIGIGLSMDYVPIDMISLSIDSAIIVKTFIACLPFVLLGSALMVLLASFTKSYKEAQSYLGMMMIIPSLPLMLLMMMSPQPSLSNMWIPSFSQGLIIIQTFKGEDIAWNLVALSMGASTLLALLLALLAVKLYQRERILG